eukprot:822794-Alexandrium_andersonii.AAC.1
MLIHRPHAAVLPCRVARTRLMHGGLPSHAREVGLHPPASQVHPGVFPSSPPEASLSKLVNRPNTAPTPPLPLASSTPSYPRPPKKRPPVLALLSGSRRKGSRSWRASQLPSPLPAPIHAAPSKKRAAAEARRHAAHHRGDTVQAAVASRIADCRIAEWRITDRLA